MTQRKGSRSNPKRRMFRGYAKLKSFVEKPEADPKAMTKQTFERWGKLLTDNKIECRFSFRIKQKDQVEYFSYELSKKDAIYSEDPLDKPDVEIFADKEAFLEIIQGNLSPIEAIGKSRLRFRGNIKLGLKLYKILAVPEGEISPCREEEES